MAKTTSKPAAKKAAASKKDASGILDTKSDPKNRLVHLISEGNGKYTVRKDGGSETKGLSKAKADEKFEFEISCGH